MSDNTEQPGGGAAPRDPWAPPDSRVELGKPGASTPPPAVHDQPTVTSMPSAGDGTGPIPAPGGFGPPPSAVPPPPTGPQSSAYAAPPPAAGSYGYPAPPVQPYGGYPGYDAYGQQPWGPAPANGLGTAAMVLGIVSVVVFCLYGLGIILGILALVFGLIGLGRAKRGEATNRGMAVAGIVLGSVGMVIAAAFLGAVIWAIANDKSDYDDSYDDPFSTSLVVEDRR
ncbi:DUF4190 domain-containing protein [Streptomyces sp. cmx-18-6]|uniref:DUF4190 domain-containing protein n=1 Tax=Streptomyces sp. cmx-18-6 TaxID=2790930 RepID=UPI00397FEAC2